MSGRNFVNTNNNGRGAVSIMLATFMLTLFTLTLMPSGSAWAGSCTPTTPTLVYPVSETVGVNNPTLDGGAYGNGDCPGGMSKYHFRVCSDGTNDTTCAANIVSETGQTNGTNTTWTVTVPVLPSTGTYYWQAQYYGGQGGTKGWSAWSSIATFDYAVSQDTVTVTQGSASPGSGSDVEQGQNLVIIHQIQLVSDNNANGQVNMTGIKVDYLGGDYTDVDTLYFYTDIDGSGGINGADASLGTVGYSGGEFTLTGLSETVTTSARYILVVVDVSATANTSNSIQVQMQADGVTVDEGLTCSPFSSYSFPVIVPPQDTVTVTQGGNSPGSGSDVAQGQNLVIIHQIQLVSDNNANGQVNMTGIKVDYLGGDYNDVDTLYFYDDTNGDGSISGDSSLGSVSYAGGEFYLNGLSETVTTTPRYILVVVDVSATADSANSIQVQMQADGVTVDELVACGTCNFNSNAFPVIGNSFDSVDDPGPITGGDVNNGSTDTPVLRIRLDATNALGDVTLSSMRVYQTSDAVDTTDISGVNFIDDISQNGTIEGGENPLGSVSYGNDGEKYYEMNFSSYSVTAGTSRDIVVAVDIGGSPNAGNQIVMELRSGQLVATSPDDASFTPTPFSSNTFTIAILQDNLDVTDGASKPSAGNVEQDANLQVIHQFTLTVDDSSAGGSVDVDQMQVFYSGTAIGDVQNLYFYTDVDGNGAINGADASLGTASPGGGNFTLDLSGGPYNVTDAGAVDINVVVDVAGNAGGGNTISVNVQTGMITSVDDTVSCTDCTFASNNFTVVGNSLDDVDDPGPITGGDVSNGSTDNPVFRIRLDATNAIGDVTLSSMRVYQTSDAVDTTDISDVNFIDDISKDGIIDGGENPLGSVSYGNDGEKYYEMNFSSYTVTAGTTREIIVAVDIGASPTGGNQIVMELRNGQLTATSPDNNPSFTNFNSNTFTITTGPPDKLKVSHGSTGQVGATTTFRGDRNVPILQFSVLTSSGTGGNDSITISEMYLNFYEMGSGNVVDNFISSNMVKLYQDNDPYGSLDNTDVFNGVFTCDSSTCTITNLTDTVNNSLPSNHFIVTGNTTSTPIYSAFKVGLNDGGGFNLEGSDAMATNNPSGVTSANITQDYDRKMSQGWNLITASQADTGLTYNQAFSDDTDPYVPYMIEWENSGTPSSWNCGSPNCQWSTTVQNNTMVYGEAFFLYAEEDGQVLDATSGSYATGEQSVTLEIGGNIVGNPYNKVLVLDPADYGSSDPGVYIKQGANTPVSLKQASINGWVEADIFWYNGNTYEAVNADGAVDPYNNMVPWRGYWIRSLKDDVTYQVIFVD